MNLGNFENNVLSMLAFASTRATWVSASSCAEGCNLSYRLVWFYLNEDTFGQVADFYRYDYRIRRRGRTRFGSAVSRGYA